MRFTKQNSFINNLSEKHFSILYWVFTILSLIMWDLAVLYSNTNYQTFGIFNGLHFSYYIGLIFTLISFSVSVYKFDKRFNLLVSSILLFFYLFGITIFLSLGPRIFSGFQYIGHWEYIDRNMNLDPQNLWYHSWPGFFLLIGNLFSPVINSEKYYVLFTIYPLIFRLLFILFIVVLTKNLSYIAFKKEIQEKKLLILPVFLINLYDWISQDYFSSQSISLLIFLAGFNLICKYYILMENEILSSKKMIINSFFILAVLSLFIIALLKTHILSSVYLTGTFFVFLFSFYYKKIKHQSKLSKKYKILFFASILSIIAVFIAILFSSYWFQHKIETFIKYLINLEPRVFLILFENISSSNSTRLIIYLDMK